MKNNFTIAWRNLSRNKTTSFINIAGLATGMACVLLILFYVRDETSYDRNFQDADHIFQVNLFGNLDGTDFKTGNTPPTVGPALQNSFPEIESYVRIHKPGELVIRTEDESHAVKYFSEKNILGVDSNFLEVFKYKMTDGNPETCLDKPNTVVITENTARKYFGDHDPVGKVLLFDSDRKPFTVTGVVENPPDQVTWNFDMLASISSFQAVKQFSWSWVWLQVNTYVKLKDNFNCSKENISSLETKFPAMVKAQAATAFRRIGQPLDELYKKGGRWDFHLQPLTDVHLHSADIGSRITTLSDIKYVYIFSFIAIIIMILACVNFMNLSTAQSAMRAKEVGIKKLLGSGKRELVKQFLSESLLFSFISLFLAFILIAIFLQTFNSISGKNLGYTLLFSNGNWAIAVALAITTGLLAGIYPAFYLTSFKPAAVLKGKTIQGRYGSAFIRNALVVFQFAVSTALIFCTVVVYYQLYYMRSQDIGLKKENVLVIGNAQRLGNFEEPFRNEIKNIPGIISVSKTSASPTQINFADLYEPVAGKDNETVAKDISLPSFVVDEDFVPALGIKIISGRNFSKDFNDSTSVIVNESAVQQIGWKNPIGQTLIYPGNGQQQFTVIGVAKDFNLQSLRNVMGPFALFHASSKTYDLGISYLLARMEPGNMQDKISKIESKWKAAAPDAPLDYSFLDEDFDTLYRSDVRMSAVFSIFTVLSIFVGCLGLFGLSAFTAERRTKEIGIRKVLGASASNLLAMLSKDFIKRILLSCLIGFPIAWWSMNQWLQDFAFRIHIQWWMFLFTSVAALVITVITISIHTIKASTANPINALRTE